MLGWIHLGTSLCMESSTWHWQGCCGQYPKDLLMLPEVCLESLLYGWQENDVSHHPEHLISVCPALSFSAEAAENVQVKHNVCKNQPCATGCSCALSVQLQLFVISGNCDLKSSLQHGMGVAVCVLQLALWVHLITFFS